MNITKKIILIDLDGVLNQYDGVFEENFIPPIKSGAREFIMELAKDFEVKIFTTRNKILTSKWLIKNNIDIFISDVTNIKELSWLYIDDRCLQFNGDFKELFEKIKNFRPWYKKFV